MLAAHIQGNEPPEAWRPTHVLEPLEVPNARVVHHQKDSDECVTMFSPRDVIWWEHAGYFR
jgi:hypothetical protein